MQTAKRISFPMQPLRMLAPVLGSLLLVMAAVDVLLAYQPSVLRPLRDGWQTWAGPRWIPASSVGLMATSIAIACIAIAAAVLASLIRGVQTLPYARLWTALAFVASGAAAGYGVGYLPLKTKLTAQHARMQHEELQQRTTLHALRSGFAAERAALQQQLEDATARSRPIAEADPTVATPETAAAEPVEPATASTPMKSPASGGRSQAHGRAAHGRAAHRDR